MMIERINTWFTGVFVATPSDIFSPAALISAAYLIAFIYSFSKARQNTERLSHFMTIAVITGKHLFAALLMEHALRYINNHQNVANIQNIYLVYGALNVLSIILLKKLHLRFSYIYTPLYESALQLMAITAVLHIALWLKLVIFNLQYEFAYLHTYYSVSILAISIAQAVMMLYPKVLTSKARYFINPLLLIGR